MSGVFRTVLERQDAEFVRSGGVITRWKKNPEEAPDSRFNRQRKGEKCMVTLEADGCIVEFCVNETQAAEILNAYRRPST